MKYWLEAYIHPTWHFTVACAGIVAGLAFSVQGWAALFMHWSWLLLGGLVVVIALVGQWRWLLVVAFIGGSLIGLSRGTSQIGQLAIYDFILGSKRTVVGLVVEDADTDKAGNMTLRLDDVVIDSREVEGELWVSLADDADIKRSDTVTVNGEIEEGFGSFAGVMYRADLQRIARPNPGDVALRVRDNFGEHVRKHIHEPAASLGMGYVAGQKRSLPEDLDAALRATGLTHVVVASGYNLTILVRFARRFFARISRFLTVFTAGVLIVGFIGVTGLSPSMTRAGLVAGLALAAWYFGRKFHPITLIMFAAAVTGLLNPDYVWGNLGWQLSFLSFAGVMILAPLIQAYFFGDKKPGDIRQIVGETLSAQIMTMPLIMYAFGTVSTVALIANVLVLPLVPLAMLLVFLTGAFSYIFAPFAIVLAWPTQGLLDYMVSVAMGLSAPDWSRLSIAAEWWWVAGLYILIVLMVIYFRYQTRLNLRDSSIIE